MNAKPLDAWPPGKHRPGPPSTRPRAQCDTCSALPPNVRRSHGQLVRLAFLIRLTASSDRPASATTSQRSRLGRRSPGHRDQTINNSQATVIAWRRPSCSTAESSQASRSAKPWGDPIACITAVSRPDASQSRVKASRPSSQAVGRERRMRPL